MTRWTGALILQQVVMFGLWVGFIKYLALPTIRDVLEELRQ